MLKIQRPMQILEVKRAAMKETILALDKLLFKLMTADPLILLRASIESLPIWLIKAGDTREKNQRICLS